MKLFSRQNKIDDANMVFVVGGSTKEMVSDEHAVASMLNLKIDTVNPGIVMDAFAKAGVMAELVDGKEENKYYYNTRRISRYEALVRMGRANGKPTMDMSPYIEVSKGYNA